MRDTTTIARPYFRESTDALASLVATRPAREVLLSVAAELSHRERPAARRLAATVAELLGGVAAIVPAPMTKEVGLDHPDMRAAIARAQAIADALPVPVAPAKPARKPAAPKVKRPGDIGWKPRSLETIIRSAGLAPMSWDAETHGLFKNVMLAMREHGLMARGFERGGPAGDGCTTWRRGADRILVGPYGALYQADGTMRQLPREERDAITEDGRAGIAAAVAAERLRVKRAEARAKAKAAWQTAKQYRALVRDLKTPHTPSERKQGIRGRVLLAWKARAEARAI